MSIGTATKVHFSRAVKAGKLIRTAFARLLFNIGDPQVAPRLGAAMLKVVQTDEVHDFGYKTAQTGDLRILNGFEFNHKKQMAKHFFVPFEIGMDRESGVCTICLPKFNPEGVMRSPHWDSYFRFVFAAACFDFEKETYCVDLCAPEREKTFQAIGHLAR